MSRKPTARTIERRLWEETQREYIIFREYCIYPQFAKPILAHGKRLGKVLQQIHDDPDIVNNEDFFFLAVQLLEEGQKIRERVLWKTQTRMQKEGYEIQGGE